MLTAAAFLIAIPRRDTFGCPWLSFENEIPFCRGRDQEEHQKVQTKTMSLAAELQSNGECITLATGKNKHLAGHELQEGGLQGFRECCRWWKPSRRV